MTTGLVRLRLQRVLLYPLQDQGGNASGVLQLLQLLAQLRALQVLELNILNQEWPQQLSLYSALTASSSLQTFHIANCPFQAPAWARVFAAGRQLPHLTGCYTTAEYGARSAPFEPTALAGLVSCCPALRELGIATRMDAPLAPLTALTGLTGLVVSSVMPAYVRDVAALTQLQQLSVSVVALPPVPLGNGQVDPPGLLRALMPLTALTCLTSLKFGRDDMPEPNPYSERFWLRNKVGTRLVVAVVLHIVLATGCVAADVELSN
jgi:hypothetical protein